MRVDGKARTLLLIGGSLLRAAKLSSECELSPAVCAATARAYVLLLHGLDDWFDDPNYTSEANVLSALLACAVAIVPPIVIRSAAPSPRAVEANGMLALGVATAMIKAPRLKPSRQEKLEFIRMFKSLPFAGKLWDGEFSPELLNSLRSVNFELDELTVEGIDLVQFHLERMTR